MPTFETLKKPKIFLPILAGIIVVAICIGVVLALQSSSQEENSTESQQASNQVPQQTLKDLAISPNSPSLLIYGYWANSKSNIISVNLVDGTETTLATLPLNIKKVTALKNGDLMFINGTNETDQGTEIAIYSPTSQTQRVIYTVTPTYGIDDYVLSPDEQNLAVWEVSFVPGETTLKGGKSQVVTKHIGTVQTFTIYPEIADKPVHYPRAILNDGSVYYDLYMPGTNAGWAYGMSVSDSVGSVRTDQQAMTNGTYSTQPNPSPDGKYLVFVGYDGSQGHGVEEILGFRRALLQGNTIELYNTDNGTRSIVIPASENTTFTSANIDSSGNIIYTAISKDSSKNGTFVYTPSTKQKKKLASSGNYLNAINSQLTIIGTPNTQQSTIGNLGANYSPTYTSLSVFDMKSTVAVPIETRGNMIQYIALTTPEPAFSLQNTASSSARKNLQLETFDLKPQLAPKRLTQQNSNYCLDIFAFQCAEQHNETEFFSCVEQKAQGSTSRNTDRDLDFSGSVLCLIASNNKPFVDCVDQNSYAGWTAGECMGSPLYLYGPENTQVDITICTPIASYGPRYKGKFSATLSENNTFIIDGKRWESLEYSYISAKKNRTAPEYGTVVSRTNLATEVKTYAQKLGLNQKETNDLVAKAVSTITKPFVFVSFYDQKTSKEILPISFDPQPDTYINYVFYFKELDQKPNHLPLKPIFPPIEKRGEFTAVEISEIFE